MSSSFVCGALAFLFILFFSLCALSSRLVRAPSAAVFIAMDHGCAALVRIQTSAECY